MKTEKEIRDRLELCLKVFKSINADYDRYIGTIWEDKYIPDICNEWTRVKAEIDTLKWMLGE